MANGQNDGKVIAALSPSRAKDFLQCPKLFYYKTVLGIRTPPSEATLRGTMAHHAFERVFDHPVGERGVETALAYVEPAWAVITDPLRERATVPPGSFEDRLRLTEKCYRDLHEPGSPTETRLLTEAEEARRLVPAERLDDFLETVRGVVRGWYAMENPEKFTPTERELYVRAKVGRATVHGFIDRFDAVPAADGAVRHYVSDYKGLALDTPLPTPTGWTTMGRVRVGDRLLGSLGEPVTVTETTPEQRRECFEITFDDGTSLVADDVHLWMVLTPEPGVHPTAALPGLLRTGEVHLPAAVPVNLPGVDAPCDPYAIGPALSTVETLHPESPEFRTLSAVTRGDHAQRLALLRGLRAAAGARYPDGVEVRDETVAALLSEVITLSGLPARRWVRTAGALRHPLSDAELAAAGDPADAARSRRLIGVRPVASVPTRCVAVDAPDRLYLAGRGMVPTHNTGKKPSPRFEDEAFFQLEVYALALAEARGVTTDQLRLVYTNEARPDGVLARNVTPAMLARTRAKIHAVWDGIEKAGRTGVWPTRKQRLCDWCHFQDVCPAWRPELEGLLPEEIERRLSGPSAD